MIHIIERALFVRVLKRYGAQVHTIEKGVYFKIPYWFEVKKNGAITLHTKTPEDLSMFLAKAGLGGDNPQIIFPEV